MTVKTLNYLSILQAVDSAGHCDSVLLSTKATSIVFSRYCPSGVGMFLTA